MSNTVSNVAAGKPKIGGAIYTAAITATLPTTADATLGNDFVCLGYISEEGLRNENGPTSEDIKAWGGDTVMVTQTDKTDTLAVTLIEALNSDVLSAVFGSDNVSGALATGISISVNADVQEEAIWVVDMVLNGDTAKRIVVPNGVISDLADIVYKDDSAIGYGLTISCLPDSSGNTHYEYIKKASTT